MSISHMAIFVYMATQHSEHCRIEQIFSYQTLFFFIVTTIGYIFSGIDQESESYKGNSLFYNSDHGAIVRIILSV